MAWRRIAVALRLAASVALALGAVRPGEGRAEAPQGRWSVTATAETLSVEAAEAPLGALLEAIARDAGIELRYSARAGEATVSIAFPPLPLAAGLDRLLRGMNYGIVWAEEKEPARIVRLFVLSAPQPWLGARRSAVAAGRGPLDRALGAAAPGAEAQELGPDLATARAALAPHLGRLAEEIDQSLRPLEDSGR